MHPFQTRTTVSSAEGGGNEEQQLLTSLKGQQRSQRKYYIQEANPHGASVCDVIIIGASLSEPHTSAHNYTQLAQARPPMSASNNKRKAGTFIARVKQGAARIQQ